MAAPWHDVLILPALLRGFHPVWGGQGVTNQPGMVTAADTSRTKNKQTMHTVVYNPECNLKPQD
eukprot:9223217-Pyramimonas_sp.AAC.1